MRIQFVLYNTEFTVDLELPLIPDRGHTIHADWLYSLIHAQYESDQLPVKDAFFLVSGFAVMDVIWKSDKDGVYVEVVINDSEYFANF